MKVAAGPSEVLWFPGEAVGVRATTLIVFCWLALIVVACTQEPGDVGARCSTTADCASDELCMESGRCESSLRLMIGEADVGVLDAGRARAAELNLSEDPLWSSYGTTGSLQESSSQLNETGYCDLGDVRTDDLQTSYEGWYPEGYWGDEPIAQSGGRCGDDLETLSWRLMNCERLTHDLEPLACDVRLVWMGRQHGADMVSRSFFGHVNPDGSTPFNRFESRGIAYQFAGENVARQRSVLDAHLAWMNSPLHRRNILTEQFRFAGVGVVRNDGQLLLTESFVGQPLGQHALRAGDGT